MSTIKMRIASLIILASLFAPACNVSSAQEDESDFVGLWSAERNFAPGASGNLEISLIGGSWYATIENYEVGFATKSDERVEFRLPNNQGYFRGRHYPGAGEIRGHWIQPPLQRTFAPMASPLTLKSNGEGVFSGDVVLLENTMTMFLHVEQDSSGRVGAVLRNPEANIGRFYDLRNTEVDNNSVRFLDDEGRHQISGTYNPDWGQLSIYLPYNGGTYDFRRVENADDSGFYPLTGRTGAAYVQPKETDDGWITGTIDQVGLSAKAYRNLISEIVNQSMNSIDAPQVHSVLVAKEGKLVVEEYFHGYHREKHHGTRSASKTVTATLIGTAEYSGDLSRDDSVFEVMARAGYDVRSGDKSSRMTVEDLITMSSGFDCNDWDMHSPGGEDRMQNQTDENDWHQFMLNLSVVNEPGESAYYCSGGMNLAGGVVAAETGSWVPEYFHEHVARPLGIESYYFNLSPTGQGYGGGGIFIRPRDFLKIGQLFLDGGVWKDRRVLENEWTESATSVRHHIGDEGYGFGWWIFNYSVGEREIEAYYAGGNGGQYVIVVPEFDIVVAFFGGNYNQRVQHQTKYDYVLRYLVEPLLKRR